MRGSRPSDVGENVVGVVEVVADGHVHLVEDGEGREAVGLLGRRLGTVVLGVVVQDLHLHRELRLCKDGRNENQDQMGKRPIRAFFGKLCSLPTAAPPCLIWYAPNRPCSSFPSESGLGRNDTCPQGLLKRFEHLN